VSPHSEPGRTFLIQVLLTGTRVHTARHVDLSPPDDVPRGALVDIKFDHLLPAISGISVHLIWNGPLEHPLDELALRRVSQERMRYKRIHHVPRFDSDRHATELHHERNEMYKLVVSATSVVDLRTLIHTGTVATCVLSAFGRLGMKTGGFWLP
jgi:hypothetical protein